MKEVRRQRPRRSRREILAGMGAFAAAPLLGPGFVRRAWSSDQPVTVLGWGGTWQEALEDAYFKPFTESTGIPVTYLSPFDFARLRAMHMAGQQEVDVILAGALDSPRMIELGMNAPLDFSVIDRSVLSPQQLIYGDAIGAVTTSTVFVYNKARWSEPDAPNSWADFWDVDRFPGPRAMQRQVHVTLEAALLADGVPADQEAMYPLDVERAFRKLDEIKPHVTKWWTTGSESQQLVRDEEVDLAVMWNGRASDTIVNGDANYEIVWNQALYNGPIEAWFLLKDSPNPEGGMRLLDYLGRAEPQAAFAEKMFYGPTNEAAYDLIDPDLARQLPSHPDNVGVSLLMDYEWWREHTAELTERFEHWIQS